MTELTFLVDLLLNHKLPKATREAVAARIKDVEAGLGQGYQIPAAARPTNLLPPGTVVPPHLVGQPASTIAAMMRHEQAGAPPAVPIAQPDAAVVLPGPVAVIAQTPAAAAAMSARQATINAAVSGKPAQGQTSPKKW